jgi:hypothetical protein
MDEDGEPLKSCVIVAVDAQVSSKATKAKTVKIPRAAQTALRALNKALAEVGEAAPGSNHIPPATRVVTVDQWRTYAYRMGVSTSDEPRAKRKAFQSATEALIAANAIGMWEPHVWQTER